MVKKFLENVVLSHVFAVAALRTCAGDQRLDIEISIPSLDRFTNIFTLFFLLRISSIPHNARGYRRPRGRTLSMVFPPEEDS